MHPDTWLDSRNRRSKIDEQTAILEERLNQAGVVTRREGGPAVALVGICTGEAEILTPFRNINLLPSVAAMNRSGLIKSFGFFAKDEPYLRYIVATNGPRCSLGELRSRICALHRAVSKFAALETVRALGISVEYRGTEVTFRREQDGSVSAHPHANVIVNCKRFLGADWRQFLEVAQNHFGAWAKDCGRLQDPAECIKYICKPGELLELTAAELAQVHQALYGLKLSSPMGAFAQMRREHEAEGVKPAKRITSEGDWKWCLAKRPKRVRGGADPDDEESEGSEAQEETETETGAADPVNLLVSITAPQPRFRPRLEPCMVVLGYQGDLEKIAERAGLSSFVAASRAIWAAAEAAAEGGALSSTPARQLSVEVPAQRPEVVKDPSKRQFVLRSRAEIAEMTGRKWSRIEGPSLVEQCFPTLARIQKERAAGNHSALWQEIANINRE